MSKLIKGFINLGKLDEARAKNHGAFFQSEKTNGVNVSVWINDTPDQYGNIASISIYDAQTKETIYIGNLKEHQPQQQQSETKPPF